MRVVFALMPFGAGQFYNGKFLMGTAFAAAQGGSLFFWFDANRKASQATANARAVLSPDFTDLNEDEKAQFREQSAAYIKGQRQNGMFGLIGFGSLWGLSTLEAIFNPPPPPAPRNRRRAATEFSLWPEIYASEADDSTQLQSFHLESTPTKQLYIGPAVLLDDNFSNKLFWTISLDIKF